MWSESVWLFLWQKGFLNCFFAFHVRDGLVEGSVAREQCRSAFAQRRH